MMELRQVRSILLVSTLILLVLTPPCVAATKYVVEPVTHPDQITALPVDPVPVSFWSLAPREMLLFLAFMIFPAFLFPVELFFLIRIFTVLGYRKIGQDAVLYNKNRRIIFEAVQSNPGIYFNEISRITGINRGTLKHHLVILKFNRKISTLNTGGSERYFENNGYYTKLERTLLRHLREETPRKILEIILKRPDISQTEIIEWIGISGPSVSCHMAVLIQEGIVTMQKNGRLVQYRLSDAADPVLRKCYSIPGGK
jgi:predicted transcriptional regulator